MQKKDRYIQAFEKALLEIDRVQAEEVFKNCYEDQKNFQQLEHLVMTSLENIGSEWENGFLSLSQVYMSGLICEELMDQYSSEIKSEPKNTPTMAIGVLQDHHALGKRIVTSVLRAGGYEIIDLGQGLSVDDLFRKTVEKNIEILLISTLMLPSALKVKELKEQFRAKGMATKIIVGGAPFRLDNNLWKQVGADADGKNAAGVMKTIEMLTRGEEA